MENRNVTIDIAKGLGILLVVLGHNWITVHEKTELHRIIFSFHMPLFFFLAGIFISNTNQPKAFLYSKIHSLLKPYFVVLVVIGIIKLIADKVTTGSIAPARVTYFAGMIYGTGGTIEWVHLWFLPHLFMTSIFSLLIIKLPSIREISPAALLIPVFLTLGVMSVDYFWQQTPVHLGVLDMPRLPGLPWSLDLLPITSVFVIAGSLLSVRVREMQFSFLPLFVSLIVFCYLHYVFDETMDLNMRLYGNFLITTLQAISGIYICLSIASLLSKNLFIGKALAYIGSGSLFIFIFHSIFQGTSFTFLANQIDNSYVAGAMAFVAGILFPLALLKFVKSTRVLAELVLPKSNSAHTR